jgi:hypothetical protein
MKTYDVNCIWDEEASVWVAENDEIPIALEASSLDTLMDRVKRATPELLALNGKSQSAKLRFFADMLLETAV